MKHLLKEKYLLTLNVKNNGILRDIVLFSKSKMGSKTRRVESQKEHIFIGKTMMLAQS